MPKLFPALLGATALCTTIFQFNVANAQIVVSNGTTVGQQTLGVGGSILVEQGGEIDVTDQSGIAALGNGIDIQNEGEVNLEIQGPVAAGIRRGGIEVTGNSAVVLHSGAINFSILNSLPATLSTPPAAIEHDLAAINITGNNALVDISGEITTTFEGDPNPIAACQIGICIGTRLADTTSAVHSLSVNGQNNSILVSGRIRTLSGRASHAQSSAVLINGSNNNFRNTGLVTFDKLPSATMTVADLLADPQGREWTANLSGGVPLPSTANFFPDASVLLKGSGNLLVNDGVISATQTATASAARGNLAAISAYWDTQDGNTIYNNGVIDSDGLGIQIRNGFVLNNGIIEGRGGITGSPTPTAGVAIFNSFLNNTGEITSPGSAVTVERVQPSLFGQYPTFAIEDSQIFNSGVFQGSVSGLFVQHADSFLLHNTGSILGARAAQFGGGAAPSIRNVEILNFGDITGTVIGLDTILSTQSFEIKNYGSISGGNLGINSRRDSPLSIANQGEIFGKTAIEMTEGALQIDNSGRIYTTGVADQDYAILLGKPIVPGDPFTFANQGDDEISFRAGTRVIGRMNLGFDNFFAMFDPTLLASQYNGNDTITLDRTSPDIAWRWTFDNFDIPGQDPFDAGGLGDSLFILGNNVPYYIWNGPVTGDYGPFPSEGGITVYIPNISGIFAANGIMEDIARTVHGGIRNRLNEGWDHENLPQDLFYRSEDDIVLRDGSDLIGAPLEALDPAVFRKAPPLTVWAKGFGGIRNEAGTDNYGDYSHLWMGGMAGLDLRSSQGDENDDGLRDTEDDDHWNIGVLGGYVQSDLTFASGFKDIQSDFFFAGAYGRLVRDALYLDASVIGGFGGMSEYGPIANNLVPGGIENPGEGYSTDGRFISPSASFGKRFYITDTISFTPEINATYLAQWIDGSTSPLTLSIEDRFIDTVFGHVQGSVKKVIKRDNSTIIGELRGGLYMSRQLHGDETNLSVVSNQFTIDTSREDIVSPYVGLGATWEIADNFKLSADGEMDFGDLDGGRARFGASLSF